MYAKARRGEIKDFTRIDGPYKEPEKPEIALFTVSSTSEENAHVILQYLIDQGFVRKADSKVETEANLRYIYAGVLSIAPTK